MGDKPPACALSLTLLLDESSSIVPKDWEKQTRGTAAALTDSQIVQMIASNGGMAIQAIGFNATPNKKISWHYIAGDEKQVAAQLQAFAKALEAAGQIGGGTEIGVAVEHVLDGLPTAPCRATRQVIDISTDGGSSSPGLDWKAKERAENMGVQINAIGIGSHVSSSLRKNVVTEDGAVWSAENWDAFFAAIRHKIFTEVAGKDAPTLKAAQVPVPPRVHVAGMER